MWTRTSVISPLIEAIQILNPIVLGPLVVRTTLVLIRTPRTVIDWVVVAALSANIEI